MTLIEEGEIYEGAANSDESRNPAMTNGCRLANAKCKARGARMVLVSIITPLPRQKD